VTQRENRVPETLYRSCPIADRTYAIIGTAKDQVNDLLAFIREDPKVELCYLVLVQG
jgi:hypothetical protein